MPADATIYLNTALQVTGSQEVGDDFALFTRLLWLSVSVGGTLIFFFFSRSSDRSVSSLPFPWHSFFSYRIGKLMTCGPDGKLSL